MLKLSRMTDYAVIVLDDMAQQNCQSSASMIAQRTVLPEPTVSKIMKMLAKAGLVHAQRGAAGGYSLEKPFETISVHDVIVAIEGPIAITDCVAGQECCSLNRSCNFNGRWDFVNAEIEKTMKMITLSQLSAGKMQTTTIQGKPSYV